MAELAKASSETGICQAIRGRCTTPHPVPGKVIRSVLVMEFSRLGRHRNETPALIEAITQAGVTIYAHNLGGSPMRLGNPIG